jgi:hypothetical protein
MNKVAISIIVGMSILGVLGVIFVAILYIIGINVSDELIFALLTLLTISIILGAYYITPS